MSLLPSVSGIKKWLSVSGIKKGVLFLIFLSSAVGVSAHSTNQLSNQQRIQHQVNIQHENIKDDPIRSEDPLKFNKLRDNIFIAKGEGANSALVVGEDALLLIETKGMRPHTSQKLLAAIREISDKPIKFVLNTHSHFDHSGGNAFFAKLGTTVIAQENYQYTPISHQLRFKDKFSLSFGGQTITAYHVPVHTVDSTIIHLPESNLLFMGDNFSSKWLLYEGANGERALHQAMDLAISLINEDTLVVPGHGDVSNYNSLKRSLVAKDAFRERVSSLYKKGLNVKQIANDKTTQEILTEYEGIKNEGHPVHLRSIQDVIDANLAESGRKTIVQPEKFTGQYQLPDGNTLNVVFEEGALVLRHDGYFTAQLRPVSRDIFDLVGFPYTQNEQVQFFTDPISGKRSLTLQVPNRFVMNYWLLAGTAVETNKSEG